jgi:transposase
MHRGDPIRELLTQSQGRLDLEPVPAHSPELIPVEQLWKCLKYGRLCNFTPRDGDHLNGAVVRELEVIREDQELLRSFFHLSALPLPRALLS